MAAASGTASAVAFVGAFAGALVKAFVVVAACWPYSSLDYNLVGHTFGHMEQGNAEVVRTAELMGILHHQGDLG